MQSRKPWPESDADVVAAQKQGNPFSETVISAAKKQAVEMAIQKAVARGLLEDTGKRCVLRDGTIGIVYRKIGVG